MIEVGTKVCTDFQAARSREWLETNGIGGYASGTISGAHSRRYHGMLVAAVHMPLDRQVLLSKLEESVVIGDKRFELSANQYPGTVHPLGYEYLTGFRLDPFPVWTFLLDDYELEKKLFMVHGENTTVVSWTLKKPTKAATHNISLEVRPLLAFRDHHHLRQSDIGFDTSYHLEGETITFRPLPDAPTLYLVNNAAHVEPTGDWYRNFEYAIERERGFDFHEDLFQPCVLRFDLAEPAGIAATTEKRTVTDAAKSEKKEMRRRAVLVAAAGAKDDLSRQLTLAADQFIVARGTGHTVIAGYHWFSDWGRDTMIALPGLTLSTDRPEIAKSVLTEFAKHISEGMLPNRFPDAGEVPEYNTVDATLWFFEAIRAYLEKTGDDEFVRDVLYAKLVDIVDWHIRGTRYRIHLDTDGLLYAGEPGTQLTWMDAKIGDWVVTPRIGKAVEIQALWYNAICIMADLASRSGDVGRAERYAAMATITRESFNGSFWNHDADCLYDVIDGEYHDASIRPNQIFAVSLAHSMLESDRARKVVEKVEADLLTPFGLRSLSSNDPSYCPIYIGSPHDRDAAYHQGTVWSWLIGPFVDAYRKTHSNDHRSNTCVAAIVDAFRKHLSEAMLGQVSEIFDADAPHGPRGCAAQAWSVAELLRIMHQRPGSGSGS